MNQAHVLAQKGLGIWGLGIQGFRDLGFRDLGLGIYG